MCTLLFVSVYFVFLLQNKADYDDWLRRSFTSLLDLFVYDSCASCSTAYISVSLDGRSVSPIALVFLC